MNLFDAGDVSIGLLTHEESTVLRDEFPLSQRGVPEPARTWLTYRVSDEVNLHSWDTRFCTQGKDK